MLLQKQKSFGKIKGFTVVIQDKMILASISFKKTCLLKIANCSWMGLGILVIFDEIWTKE